MIGIPPIFPIPVIDPFLPFDAIPRIVAGAVTAFKLAELPPSVQTKFRKGKKAWRDAVREAIAAGIKDPKKLADIIFFMHHPERMTADVGRLIARDEPEFMKVRAEWEHDLAIANRRLTPGFTPDVFLDEERSSKYEEFVTKKTTGLVTMMVHGRNFDGKGGWTDDADYYDRMQEVVDTLGDGDTLYFASWQFFPGGVSIPARATDFSRTWTDLLTEKAKAGVKIRAIITHQPPGSIFVTNTNDLDTMIKALLEKQDNFKYIFIPHADALRGTHHQKFMVARKGKSTVAFCGGLDLSFARVPQRWMPKSNFVWHDVAAKLEGLIAHDLERQFVELWNRDRSKATNTALKGWKAFETLTVAGASGEDKKGASNQHAVQMLRTVSLGPEPKQNQRDDIWRDYVRIISRSRRFLYLENQYFNQPELADEIVRQVQSSPGMIVIVAVGTGTDDKQTVDPDATGFELDKQQVMVDSTNNAFALRLEFFKRLQPLYPTFLRVYTLHYPGGTIHTKLILGDDEVLSVGSANANPRSFIFDTEVNFVLEHPETVQAFRHQLWGHNLHVDPKEVAKWNLGDFFTRWDDVAKANQRLDKTPEKMVGERVIPFVPWDPKDPRFRAGRRGPLRTRFLDLDAPEGLF